MKLEKRYSREDGLPSKCLSAGQVVCGIIAARAVRLLAPVDARHQSDLQERSQHGAHNLQIYAERPCNSCNLHMDDAPWIDLWPCGRMSALIAPQSCSRIFLMREALRYLTCQSACKSFSLSSAGAAHQEERTCLCDDVDECRDPVKIASCHHSQCESRVKVAARDLLGPIHCKHDINGLGRSGGRTPPPPSYFRLCPHC